MDLFQFGALPLFFFFLIFILYQNILIVFFKISFIIDMFLYSAYENTENKQCKKYLKTRYWFYVAMGVPSDILKLS